VRDLKWRKTLMVKVQINGQERDRCRHGIATNERTRGQR
jgi:hypothetical protein